MTPRLDAKYLIGALVAAILLGAVLGGLALRSCTPHPPPTVVGEEIDAGPGEAVIAGHLDGAVQADERAILEIEERNARAIDLFDQQEQAEYEQARRGGRQAVARYLSDFNTQLKTDAGIQ